MAVLVTSQKSQQFNIFNFLAFIWVEFVNIICDFTRNIKINIFVLQLSHIIIIFVCGVGDDSTCPLTYGPWWLTELKYSEDGGRRPRLGRLEQPDCTTPSAESIPCERKIQPKRQTHRWDKKLGQVKIITNKNIKCTVI